MINVRDGNLHPHKQNFDILVNRGNTPPPLKLAKNAIKSDLAQTFKVDQAL